MSAERVAGQAAHRERSGPFASGYALAWVTGYTR
jgi:hypothetical protein